MPLPTEDTAEEYWQVIWETQALAAVALHTKVLKPIKRTVSLSVTLTGVKGVPVCRAPIHVGDQVQVGQLTIKCTSLENLGFAQ